MNKKANTQEERQPSAARVYCTSRTNIRGPSVLVPPTEDNLRALITETIQDDLQTRGPIYQMLASVLRSMKLNKEL